MENALRRAAELIAHSDGLLITAGAGIGIDSGLPDFRGPQGFWTAYPELGRRQIDFAEIASPQSFLAEPELAWGFYGHRLALYRETVPHTGFAQLLALAERQPHRSFVVTSNVDGQFQKAGFSPNRVWEIHGSLHHLQCLDACCGQIWPASALHPVIDTERCRLLSPLPRCPACGGIARPNILMFNDDRWLAQRSRIQQAAFETWLSEVERPVIVEIGAGSAIASIRALGERLGFPLIRINPGEARVTRSVDLGIALGAREAIAALSTLAAKRYRS
jgi:NAD-dependent SIR2 family protein deacetylase